MGKEVNFGKLLHGGDYNPESVCFRITRVLIFEEKEL